MFRWKIVATKGYQSLKYETSFCYSSGSFIDFIYLLLINIFHFHIVRDCGFTNYVDKHSVSKKKGLERHRRKFVYTFLRFISEESSYICLFGQDDTDKKHYLSRLNLDTMLWTKQQTSVPDDPVRYFSSLHFTQSVGLRHQ